MTSISFCELMLVVLVLVDEWYQSQIAPTQRPRAGAKAQFSESEVLSLVLLMDDVPFPEERQFLGFIGANYGSWLPHLLEQSQFNRRLRQLDGLLEQLRRSGVMERVETTESYFIVDIKPIAVLGLKRGRSNIDTRSHLCVNSDTRAGVRLTADWTRTEKTEKIDEFIIGIA